MRNVTKTKPSASAKAFRGKFTRSEKLGLQIITCAFDFELTSFNFDILQIRRIYDAIRGGCLNLLLLLLLLRLLSRLLLLLLLGRLTGICRLMSLLLLLLSLLLGLLLILLGALLRLL